MILSLVDAYWNSWSSWTLCALAPPQCVVAKKYRWRTCEKPPNGADCEGEDQEAVICDTWDPEGPINQNHTCPGKSVGQLVGKSEPYFKFCVPPGMHLLNVHINSSCI